jgi:tRNA pseudouridine38-40 synthase
VSGGSRRNRNADDDGVPTATVRAYRIAYDGRPFHGFQRQPDVPTVEGAILDALADLDLLPAEGDPTLPTPPGYAAAGRTDAGVSALAQTVAFEAPDWLTPRALNGELPPDVRAWAAADVSGDFHATHDAVWRSYRYFLFAPGLDAAAAREVLARFEGAVDLHNLARTDGAEDTVRTVQEATAHRDGDFLVVDVRADGFLHESVRRLVRYLRRRLSGDESAPAPDRLLSAERVTGPAGVGPAPPAPLVLRGVAYDGVEFAVDATARESLRSVFERRRRRAAARERVTGALRDAGER